MRRASILLWVIPLVLFSPLRAWSAVSSKQAESAKPVAGGGATSGVKSSLAATELRLGAIESWQKRIFDEEILSQPQRFVRNIEAASGGGVPADVDLGAIREYIKFHSSKVQVGESAAAAGAVSGASSRARTIVAQVAAPASCAECVAAVARVKPLIATRLDRRGYAVSWVEGAELQSGGARSGEISGALGQLAESPKGRSAAGAWWVEIKLVPPEELDQGHADEKIFRVSSRLAIFRPGRGSYSSLVKPLLQHDARTDLREGESVEASLGGMISDSFADFGAQLDTALASTGASRATDVGAIEKSERIVQASGFRDFEEFQKVKTALEARLGESVELRSLARGRAEFAISSERPEKEVRASLAGALEGAGSGEKMDGVQLELKQ